VNEIEALYRQYAPAILRFAWRLSGDRSTAEDILSETFVRLMTRPVRIEPRTALAYLLTIARNVYFTRQRRRRREISLLEELPGPELDPAQRLDDETRLGAMLRALHALPEGERAALLLRVDHDLAYDDIAASLGISVLRKGSGSPRPPSLGGDLQRQENKG
jgi:RNA polymerase sigma-70 factor (ECF subfamily)